MELIQGESLNQWLAGKRRRVAMRVALRYSIEIARLVAQIHSAGWVWRDCKPGNIMITKRDGLRPIDFEGACSINNPDPSPWGTRSFVPPEWDEPFRGQSRLPEDLYALGAVIYLMLAGVAPNEAVIPLHTLRKNVPEELSRIVTALLNPAPNARPQAAEVAAKLARLIT